MKCRLTQILKKAASRLFTRFAQVPSFRFQVPGIILHCQLCLPCLPGACRKEQVKRVEGRCGLKGAMVRTSFDKLQAGRTGCGKLAFHRIYGNRALSQIPVFSVTAVNFRRRLRLCRDKLW